MGSITRMFSRQGALVVLVLAGCTRETAEPQTQTQAPAAVGRVEAVEPPPATTTQDAGQDPDLAVITITAVDIDTRLAMLCGLEQSKVFFKFDSAKLLPEAKERLEQIAKCVTGGPAKDKELVVVGRTDPVGPDAYNKELGMSRAESVQQQLRQYGVSKTRLETESRGEAAAGPNPLGWPFDRRVTVRIQE